MIEKELKNEPNKILLRLYIQQVKHGKWIPTGKTLWHTKYRCSECDNYLFLDSKNNPLYLYCPYCGAKMDKKDDENG